MSGTITQFQRDRGGVGTLLGEDRKSYTFRRTIGWSTARGCGFRDRDG